MMRPFVFGLAGESVVASRDRLTDPRVLLASASSETHIPGPPHSERQQVANLRCVLDRRATRLSLAFQMIESVGKAGAETSFTLGPAVRVRAKRGCSITDTRGRRDDPFLPTELQAATAERKLPQP